MATPKQHGGDLFDKLQAHNRNAALDKQNKLKEEANRIAKEEKQAAAAHRAEMAKLEQQRTETEAQRVQLLREEKVKQAHAHEQNKQIHTLSRNAKQLKKIVSPVERYIALRDIEQNLAAVDIDAVTEIEYRDRFSDTQDALVEVRSGIQAELSPEKLECLSSYDALAADIDRHAQRIPINSFKAKTDAETLLKRASDLQNIFPELCFDHADFLRGKLADFELSVACFAAVQTLFGTAGLTNSVQPVLGSVKNNMKK